MKAGSFFSPSYPASAAMRFRKLRIAWSVFWGLACVLLIVLWVRSYWMADYIFSRHVGMCSATGVVQFEVRLRAGDYQWASIPANESKAISPRFQFHFWFRPDIGGYVNIQYPFLVLILSISATVSHIRRFSLRTLLIATTLTGVVLGLIVLSL